MLWIFLTKETKWTICWWKFRSFNVQTRSKSDCDLSWLETATDCITSVSLVSTTTTSYLNLVLQLKCTEPALLNTHPKKPVCEYK